MQYDDPRPGRQSRRLLGCQHTRRTRLTPTSDYCSKTSPSEPHRRGASCGLLNTGRLIRTYPPLPRYRSTERGCYAGWSMRFAEARRISQAL